MNIPLFCLFLFIIKLKETILKQTELVYLAEYVFNDFTRKYIWPVDATFSQTSTITYFIILDELVLYREGH